MAERNRVRRMDRRYTTHGNVAYQPEPVRTGRSGAVRQEPERSGRRRIQPRTYTRPTVQVRPQGAVAPFAVVGFAAVMLCALLLVMSSAQMAALGDEIVDLRASLSDLQEEERTLRKEHELAFDMAAIEEMFTANGTMSRPSAGQTVYLDLSEGDSVVYYGQQEAGLDGMLRWARQLLDGPAE